ncbi:protein NEOXANTHIN-DEFICIENT 1 isoform X4 [Coffea arabica]|uniref:Protein NEOXANTHIN-DEFICIENT 1 isoform X4 n=1 Tax=Coffea arabica TaxID=13443 RepID=A0ABM4WB70_COFAR
MKEENDVNGSKILKVEPMDHRKTHSPSGYGKPPWVFRGSALYQLHLVKAETARAFIPKEFRLVEAFGYTLGGFFLANYDDSPAGKFDELVVIAGTVWNPPTSCAWAARVLVNSDEACIHGQKVGIRYWTSKPSCKIFKASELESSGWMGPLVKLSLPSFSGRTKYNHHLLKYSCQIECRVRAVAPAKVLGPPPPAVDVDEERSCRELRRKKRSLSVSVLLSKPILALQFNRLEMKVEAPTTVCKR